MNLHALHTDISRFRQRRRVLTLALACALGGGLSPAAALADDAPADQRIKALDAVQVIRAPEDPQGTTGSAYVLGAQELEKFKRTNANDVLRGAPGVYVREEDGLGVFPRIGVRASSSGRSDRISLLEDGIPAAMSPYANTSAYYFPNIGRISRIEILKGPEVLLHGPQTTSGVVNLISTPIPADRSGAADIEIGAFQTRKLHAHYGATIGQWGFLLETYQGQSDGFHDIERSKHTAGYDINEYVGKLRWSSAPEARFAQQVDVKLHYDVETADVSYLGQTDADFRDDPNRRYGLSALERMDRGRRAANIRHHFSFNDDNWLETTAYWTRTYRYYNRLNQINGVNLGGVTEIVNTGGDDADLLYGILRGHADTTHANGVRYGHNHQRFTAQGVQVESHNRFTTGQVEHELIGGLRYSDETPENTVKGRSNSIYRQINGSLVYQSAEAAAPSKGEAKALALWLGDRMSFGDLTLLPVVRHERIKTKANLAVDATPEDVAARASNRLNHTSAGLGATYALSEQWTLLGGFHQGFAPPGNRSGRGTKGEESKNYEAGVRFRDGQIGIDAVGFYSDYQNTIRQCLFANPCPNPIPGEAPIVDGSTQQTGAKKVYGLELSAFGDLYRGPAISVPLRFAYTYTNGEYDGGSDLPTGVQKGDVIEYTPKHIASLQLGLAGDSGWNAYAAFNYTDSAYTSNTARRHDADRRFLTTDSLFTVDLVTSYRLTESVDAYLRVDNVFDRQRITHRGADGARGNAPRWTSIGLKLRF